MAGDAGNQGFAKTRSAVDPQALMSSSPTAIRKMRPARYAMTLRSRPGGHAPPQIFDDAALAKGRELAPRGQFVAIRCSGHAFDANAETLFERRIVEGGRTALPLRRFRNAGQAPRLDRWPALGLGWGGSAFWSFPNDDGRHHECWRVGVLFTPSWCVALSRNRLEAGTGPIWDQGDRPEQHRIAGKDRAQKTKLAYAMPSNGGDPTASVQRDAHGRYGWFQPGRQKR